MAEIWKQNIVRLGPVGIARIRGEQPVTGKSTDLLQSAIDRLVEAALIAQFVNEAEP